jgi:hypothetical protein
MIQRRCLIPKGITSAARHCEHEASFQSTSRTRFGGKYCGSRIEARRAGESGDFTTTIEIAQKKSHKETGSLEPLPSLKSVPAVQSGLQTDVSLGSDFAAICPSPLQVPTTQADILPE